MIHITFKEPINDPDWDVWREKCNAETANLCKLVDTGDIAKIKDNIYKDKKVKKKYYFNDQFKGPFFRKCSYCESSLANQDGDIEHYRPKRGVTNLAGEIDHPGYYWLVYDWKNLFPTCLRCNRKYNWEKEDGVIVTGKKNLFPLKIEANRAMSHGDNINLESPLILNPLEDNPEEHLDIDTPTGTMFWLTERGEVTLKVFGLNDRDNLVEGRKDMITKTRTLMNDLFTALENNKKDDIKEIINKLLLMINGHKEYSFACRIMMKKLYGDDYKERLLKHLE